MLTGHASICARPLPRLALHARSETTKWHWLAKAHVKRAFTGCNLNGAMRSKASQQRFPGSALGCRLRYPTSNDCRLHNDSVRKSKYSVRCRVFGSTKLDKHSAFGRAVYAAWITNEGYRHPTINHTVKVNATFHAVFPGLS